MKSFYGFAKVQKSAGGSCGNLPLKKEKKDLLLGIHWDPVSSQSVRLLHHRWIELEGKKNNVKLYIFTSAHVSTLPSVFNY